MSLVFAALVFLLPMCGALLLSYLVEVRVPYLVRISFSFVVGLIAFSLLSFALAWLIGLTWVSIGVAALGSFLIPVVVTSRVRRNAIEEFKAQLFLLKSLTWNRSKILAVVFVCFGVVFLALVFDRGFYEDNGAIMTKNVDNYADLTLHLALVNSFVHGNNFPPKHPALPKASLSYPFLVDYHAAILVKLGVKESCAFLIQNLLLVVSFVILLWWFAVALTGDRLAGVLSPILLFFNGGLGWTMLVQESRDSQDGLFGLLKNLPHDYTSFENLYRFNNSLIYWFIPMRSMLLAAPVLCTVWIFWLQAIDKVDTNRKNQLLFASGVLAGLMPLVHAHSFAILLATGAMLAFLFRAWKGWIVFALTALALALPQILSVILGSEVQPAKFLDWNFGWEKGSNNFFWYWFLNTGFFIPTLLLALAVFRRKGLLRSESILFYLPFTLWFIVPNLIKVAPWIWDNIKFFYIWFLASVPIVALAISLAWKKKSFWRLGASALFLLLVISSVLDFYRLFTSATAFEVYSKPDVEFGNFLREKTPVGSVILSSSVHNSHVLLTGRKTFLGYPGVLWTHGLSYDGYEEKLLSIYKGQPGAEEILKQEQIQYIIVTLKETTWAKDKGFEINMDFLNRFPSEDFKPSGSDQVFRLYKVPQS